MSNVNPEGIVSFYSHTFNVLQEDTVYESGRFMVKGINECDFVIKMIGSNSPFKYEVSVWKSDDENSGFAKITVSILGEEITRIVRNWEHTCFFTKETRGLFPAHIKVDCKIIWYGTTEDTIPVKASLSPFSGFHNVHLNSSLSDLKISIGGEELSAHKVILAAHSSVFLSMFETDMKEKRESRIVIEGIELNVMKIVLTILYTGYDGDLDELEKAENVLVVAERYDMKALKRLCEWKLFQRINILNVLDILDKADNCNDDTLRTECLKFIAQNKKEMAKSEYLKTICRNKPDMMCGLLQTLMIAEQLIIDE